MHTKRLRTSLVLIAMFAFAITGMLQASAGVAQASCLGDCANDYSSCRRGGGCDECEDAFVACAVGCGANPGAGICL